MANIEKGGNGKISIMMDGREGLTALDHFDVKGYTPLKHMGRESGVVGGEGCWWEEETRGEEGSLSF